MVSEAVPLLMDPPKYFRKALDVLPAHEERGRDAALAEDVEDLLGIRRQGTVIKRQCDAPALGGSAHQRRPQDLGAGDRAGVVEKSAQRAPHRRG